MAELNHPPYIDLKPVMHVEGVVRLPGSKSISNRILLLAALAEGETKIVDLLDSDDTQVMLAALRALGVEWQEEPQEAVNGNARTIHRVQGANGSFPNRQADLFMGNAGTAIRPLTAALALSGGSYRLSGVPRMHERPIGDLVDALRGRERRIEGGLFKYLMRMTAKTSPFSRFGPTGLAAYNPRAERALTEIDTFPNIRLEAAYPPIPMLEPLKQIREPFRLVGRGLGLGGEVALNGME